MGFWNSATENGFLQRLQHQTQRGSSGNWATPVDGNQRGIARSASTVMRRSIASPRNEDEKGPVSMQSKLNRSVQGCHAFGLFSAGFQLGFGLGTPDPKLRSAAFLEFPVGVHGCSHKHSFAGPALPSEQERIRSPPHRRKNFSAPCVFRASGDAPRARN